MSVGIWKQGYQRSENGWPMVDTAELDYGKVPGTNFALGVRKGVPNTLLKALIVRLNQVEPMIVTQIGCYTESNSMSNSNHNSATAIDYNWNKHQWHAEGTWGAKKPQVDRIIADFRGTIEWGGYWGKAWLDEMHFEIHDGPVSAAAQKLNDELMAGLWGIFKPGAPPVVGTTPIPAGPSTEFWLGIGSANALVLKLQHGMNLVFRTYRAMPLEEDGIYGPNTSAAVAEFQRRATEFKLTIDGEVGPKTKAALAAFGIKL
jgi:peptidoglycan hydrolase-like protein with peptidoglycan-binding domain